MAGEDPPALSIRGLGWHPIGSARAVLEGIDLAVAAGERVLLAGPSGSGKSTLLRAVAGVLTTAATGVLTGSVLRGGVAVDDHNGPQPPPVGVLLQEPSDSLVASLVGRDVAFGPENIALQQAEIGARVSNALAEVGFPYGPRHLTAALSGGERQRLALAGALALDPPLLLLDEPLAMLDPVAAADVAEAVLSSSRRRGGALLVVDHQLDRWADVVDRLVVLSSDGRIVADGPVGRVLHGERQRLLDAGLWVPGARRPAPLEVDPDLLRPRIQVPPPGRAALQAHSIGLCRAGSSDPVLAEVSLPIPAGRISALCGPSGAGKSTLASVLVGLTRPSSGSVAVDPTLAAGDATPIHRWRSRRLAARVGWVPQSPERGFVTRRVDAELAATPAALGQPDDGRAVGLLHVLGLSGRATADPYQLSGGEQRRLSLAAALVHGPGVLVLDEPTVGQDRHSWAAVAGIATAARSAGVAVLVATHDRLLLERVADQVTRLVGGRVVDAAVRR